MPERPADRRVVLGRIHGLFGVRGWVKLYSYTVPPENILDYDIWQVGLDGDWRGMRVVAGRRQGKGLVAHLAPLDGDVLADRETAAALLGADIAVFRRDMPAPLPGEYYWADLIGLRVIDTAGRELGAVSALMETGANDVLVVRGERERLIPFVRGQVIRRVDIAAGVMTVDWDPEF